MSNSISKRLKEVAKFVDQDSKIVDVGSDHAYLPINLVENKIVQSAIAGEVAEGPLSRSVENIRNHNLENKIDVRLGDGLDVISNEDNVDTAIIAGMGGILITDILQRFVERKEFEIQKLILQPNIGEAAVRYWLVKNGYKIVNENILEDEGHTYEIIVAKKSDDIPDYTRADFLLGPILRINNNKAFEKKWRRKFLKYKNTLKGIKGSKNPDSKKINELEVDLKILEELFND
ncbi:tRNA (adenine(22)-N(1))-methyltransferase [Companilactobacillus sp. DQM5]|uniref:tRNA (adenine(22)-N(1))-methyltransferase n=1 Tax=Companilactobacillus sp. DQM5 TaxID=3463359 RepID=UPI004058D923